MKFLKTVEGVCTLVTIQFDWRGKFPGLGEYDSPLVKRIRPCEVREGRYFDLRTGEEQFLGPNDEVWKEFSGMTFLYPDGTHLLVTRFFDPKRTLGIMQLEGDYNPMSMGLVKIKIGTRRTTSHETFEQLEEEYEEQRRQFGEVYGGF